MKRSAFKTTRYMLVLCAVLGATACSGPVTTVQNAQGVSVADAYNSSGVVAVAPYTRSIFSSGNF